MDMNVVIEPKKAIKPTVYAYITPTNTAKDGWIKIGYTDRDADKRIWEQTHTVGIEPKKLWDHEARFNGGGYFSDRDFHAFLTKNGIRRNKGTEWFFFNGTPDEAETLYREFVFKDYSKVQKEQKLDYKLRTEQERAVEKTLAYAKNHPNGEFLWNAKPRFGKTLTSYDLVRKLDSVNVLIVTNRPAIANSWYDDFVKFISWQSDFKFISESDSLKDRSPMTRQDFVDYTVTHDDSKQIAFLSLQDLKGSKYFRGDGGGFHKLKWVADTNWDVLIIDEAHEGVDTFKTDVAFRYIDRQFTLHLSGTPFKAIAKGSFNDEQIFNWSYEDEQAAKENWTEEENNNPYDPLPQLNMFTFQMSKMITDEVNQGVELENEKNVDFAFDLNEFFTTKDNERFVHEADVKKWLDTLTHNEKYPFSTSKLRNELKHTFWILNRVASAKALKRLLDAHPVFENYEVILAAGNGKSEAEDVLANESSFKRVRDAIQSNDKTITLSVGQLTTGITIPEWTAVMMLSNMKSPALYMQAAFRAQNPNVWTEQVNGEEIRYQKQNAYVFDFAPERTLIIFDEFANNLSTRTASGGGTSDERENNIKKLLNFFPVIGEDKEGKMVELDAAQVLTIPKAIKATEVVKRGFMSNLLFANISGIFQAPQVALSILDNMDYASQGKVKKPEDQPTIDTKNIEVDDDGQAIVDNEIVIAKTNAIFGSKVYQTEEKITETIGKIDSASVHDSLAKDIGKTVVDIFKPQLEIVKQDYEITKKGSEKIEKKIQTEVELTVKKKNADFNIQQAHIESNLEKDIEKVNTFEEKVQVEKQYADKIAEAFETYQQEVNKEVSQKIETLTKEIVEEQEQKQKTKEKTMIEEDIRGRLRGFARTIPSFIMAYGDDSLILENFDNYTPEDVFLEVTGITVGQFKFLRDGGDYQENGETHHFRGMLFDNVVFNESVQEFLRKKDELSNYFEDNEEDIFDYIPPQKTNQIYTPKWVAKKMVEDLEKENPNIYDDFGKTFADLYMKSGLYITEIVKKLYNSPVIKTEYPNDKERIKHILENQVYGLAPTEIIYKISTNFIFGNLDNNISRKNFLMEDATPYVKKGILQDLINTSFGD